MRVREWQASTYHLPKALTLRKTTGRSGLDASRDTAKDLDWRPNQKNTKSINALIYIMGDKADDILCSFGLTEDEKVYTTVRAKFDSYFEPQRNVIFQRAKFNQRKQHQDRCE